MSVKYLEAKEQLLRGDIDLAADDIRVLLVMTDSTVAAETTAATLAEFTLLDEMDGAGYSRQALANKAVTQDILNDRSVFDADDMTFATLGAGTRDVAGALIYKHVTNDADSVPILFIDSGGFPLSMSGANLLLQWHADGIMTLT